MSPCEQIQSDAARLGEILLADPVMHRALHEARAFDLPEAWIVSGAVYNTVWNTLTDRPPGHGIKDIDLFYFDPDTSYAAEDAVIRRAASHFTQTPPVEIRNQARVHLWYEAHFGHQIKPLRSCRESIARFAAITHAVGVHLDASGTVEVAAPYGLCPIFEMRMQPNPRAPNRETYEEKAERCQAHWPELVIEPWPDGPAITTAVPEDDWTETHALLTRAFAYMEGRIDPPSSLSRLTPRGLAKKAEDETCYLAWQDGKLAGCVYCHQQGDTLYINKLAVNPDLQSRGIGRLLMGAALDLAQARELGSLTLETRIELSENHRAFAAMGFEKIAETAHPDYDRPTSITMRRPL